jgi:hypothetical protein
VAGAAFDAMLAAHRPLRPLRSDSRRRRPALASLCPRAAATAHAPRRRLHQPSMGSPPLLSPARPWHARRTVRQDPSTAKSSRPSSARLPAATLAQCPRAYRLHRPPSVHLATRPRMYMSYRSRSTEPTVHCSSGCVSSSSCDMERPPSLSSRFAHRARPQRSTDSTDLSAQYSSSEVHVHATHTHHVRTHTLTYAHTPRPAFAAHAASSQAARLQHAPHARTSPPPWECEGSPVQNRFAGGSPPPAEAACCAACAAWAACAACCAA